ncbi:MAG TPA: hypothetical protein PKE65_04100 [Rhizobiaceae bacterium]|nr:hypothetical protein [Rhizobiaceae bacterium]
MADEKTAKAALERFHDEFASKRNVVGTGIQQLPGNEGLGVAVYVSRKQAPSEIPAGDAIPESVTVAVGGTERKVRVKVVDVGGEFEAEGL